MKQISISQILTHLFSKIESACVNIIKNKVVNWIHDSAAFPFDCKSEKNANAEIMELIKMFLRIFTRPRELL